MGAGVERSRFFLSFEVRIRIENVQGPELEMGIVFGSRSRESESGVRVGRNHKIFTPGVGVGIDDVKNLESESELESRMFRNHCRRLDSESCFFLFWSRSISLSLIGPRVKVGVGNRSRKYTKNGVGFVVRVKQVHDPISKSGCIVV